MTFHWVITSPETQGYVEWRNQRTIGINAINMEPSNKTMQKERKEKILAKQINEENIKYIDKSSSIECIKRLGCR